MNALRASKSPALPRKLAIGAPYPPRGGSPLEEIAYWLGEEQCKRPRQIMAIIYTPQYHSAMNGTAACGH